MVARKMNLRAPLLASTLGFQFMSLKKHSGNWNKLKLDDQVAGLI